MSALATLPAGEPSRPRPVSLAERPLMINSVRIRNFRGFADVSVANLGQINVLVGASAAGKTAFLEAVTLAAGCNADLTLRYRVFRGMGPGLTISWLRSAYQEIWRDLFYRLDQGQTIEIETKGTPEVERSVRIFYDRAGAATVPMKVFSGTMTEETTQITDTATAAVDSAAVIPIIFEWTDSTGQKHRVTPEISQLGLRFPPLTIPSKVSYFPSYGLVNIATETATQYSSLSVRKQAGRIEEHLRLVFPEIEGLSIEFNAGTAMLHCSFADLPQKVPVAMVSGGINKLLTIMIGIAFQSKGLVLIDELENGIYYKMMPKVWEVLRAFSTEFETQLIVSTHSKECLQAATGTVKGHEEDFRLLRVEREENRSIVRRFSGDVFESAIETDTEIR